MNPDPASLENLRDIVEPPPVSWWPLAPGWWLVFAVVLVAASVFGFRAWRSWKANGYRRAALREIAAAPNIATLAEILKRTALAAYPRSEVAALTGAAWCDWLEETAAQPMPGEVRDAFLAGVFAEGCAPITPSLSTYASAWISRHQATPAAASKS